MKRYTLFIAILFATFMASAQEPYDLSARGVEPSRKRTIPYHTLATAVAGDASQSRFVAAVEELERSDKGTATTFTTHFALPVAWLNRQTILRVGYASTAYTVYVNGREVGFVPTGAMGAEFNITKASKEGRNEVSLVLDLSHVANKLFRAEKMAVEGVEVFSQPTIRLRDVIAKTTLNASGDGVAEFAIPVKCDALNRKEMRLHYTLRMGDSLVVAEGYRELALDMRREDTLRFVSVVPAKALWGAKNPVRLRLDLESRIDNRIVECQSHLVGLRQIAISDGKLQINNEVVVPNIVEFEALKSLDEAQQYGYNTVVVTLNRGAESVIEECTKRGLYVVVRTPIDTTSLGDHIRRGGNPSNDPLWSESYLWRNLCAMYATQGNSAVIGYAIAKGKTSGVNIYDAYVMLKSLQPNYLVIYEGAKGEWATDK